MKRNKKPLHCLFVLAFLVCLLMLFNVGASAFRIFSEANVHDFRTDTETVYSAARAKAVLTAESTQWKLTEPGQAVMNADGLTVPAGILSIYKSNPLTQMGDFAMDISYSTAAEEGEADGSAAFLYMSAETFGKSLLLSDAAVMLSIAENGDVYSGGTKLNHADAAPAGDALTSKNPNIDAGEECVLKIQYLNGKLSVQLSCDGGNTTVTLVKDCPCAISGIRQMQLGGDKSASKRIKNVTYRAITYYEYAEYTPDEKTAAVVVNADGFREYTNAEGALDAVRTKNSEAMVELYADVTLTKPVTLSKNAAFTLDLNGHRISRNTGGRMLTNGYVFYLDENAALHITDASPERENGFSAIRGGVITGGAGDGVGGGFQMKKGAKLTMDGGSIVGCVTNDHGGAIRVAGSGVTVMLSGVGFYSNMTYDSTDNCHGGAIYADYDDCAINAENCIFEGNVSEDNGGAVYVNDGLFHADGCLFSQNKSTDHGGAVYVESGSRAQLMDCTFIGNMADGAGGAVYCNSSEGTRLSGEYCYNTAKKNGGAVYVNGDLVSIFDAEIRSNTAGGSGSGVYVDEMYDLNVSGRVVVRDNYDTKHLRNNVFLDDFTLAEAKINNGGLDAGSEIWVSVPDSEHTISDDISEYQQKYFWQDDFSKSMTFTEDKAKRENTQLVTSAIGSGNIVFILIGIAVILAAMLIMSLVMRRKNREDMERYEK